MRLEKAVKEVLELQKAGAMLATKPLILDVYDLKD